MGLSSDPLRDFSDTMSEKNNPSQRTTGVLIYPLSSSNPPEPAQVAIGSPAVLRNSVYNYT